jgi:Spy/CpxP family protein refolding chaperone
MKVLRYLLLTAAVLVSLAAFAQGPGMMSPDDQLARLTEQLKLTADQQAKIKPILQARSDEMQKLFEDQSTSFEEKRPKMMELRQSTDKKIMEVLNDEQKRQYEKIQQNRRGPGGPQ